MKIILSNEAIQHTRSLKLIKRVFGPPIDALLYENPTKFGNWNVPKFDLGANNRSDWSDIWFKFLWFCSPLELVISPVAIDMANNIGTHFTRSSILRILQLII